MSIELVRVGDAQCSLGSDDLDVSNSAVWAVPAQHGGCELPCLKLGHHAHVRRYLNRDFPACLRADLDDPGGPSDATAGLNRAEGAKDLGQRGEVVRTHVPQGTGAVGQQYLEVAVVVYGAGNLEQGQPGERSTDVSALDDPARGLQPGTQDGVGCAADAQTQGIRPVEQRLTGYAIECERFFSPDVLARFQCRGRNLGVRSRDRQVDDDVNVRLCQSGRGTRCWGGWVRVHARRRGAPGRPRRLPPPPPPPAPPPRLFYPRRD